MKIKNKITLVLVTKKSETKYDFHEDLIKEIEYMPQLGAYIIAKDIGILLVVGIAYEDNDDDHPEINNTTVFVTKEDKIILDASIFATEKRPWQKQYIEE